ncbi:6328_t:CDS:1, partial [Ambispora leptoticha]
NILTIAQIIQQAITKICTKTQVSEAIKKQILDLMQILETIAHNNHPPDILLEITSKIQKTTINYLFKTAQEKHTPTTTILYKINKSIHKNI